MLARVTTANTLRMLMTTTTTSVCAFATKRAPRTFSALMTSTTSAAKTLVHASLPLETADDA